jgi:molybdopterin molybdotransferase
VVPIEKVTVSDDTVQLPETLRKGQNIARRGSECTGEQYLLHPGAVITPLVLANLAFFGYEEVRAIPNPTIGIIITGNEIAGRAGATGEAGIRDANGPMIEAMCRHLCVEQVSRAYTGDSLEEVVAALEQFSDRDIVILSGGVSMGRKDYVPAAVSNYGAETVFHKIAQKPGKPMLFARKGDQLVFGLPGNPLSCHLCFHRYISRAVKALGGKSTETLGFAGVLSDSVQAAGDRTFFQIAAVERGADNRFVIRPLKGKGSADIFTPIRGSAYLRIDPGDTFSEGEIVLFDWFGGERWMT